ncbi:MAG: SRPBCC family protein [Chloroflexi bacterium]|nr:SRPBCC family protein [Chloroflexota bacterium]
MAQVRFSVKQDLPFPAEAVFGALIDWPGHAEWVPLTRVEILEGDGGVGTSFVATTGVGPLALPDRMQVTAMDRAAMTVTVVKIGPILTGEVYLKVHASTDRSCVVDWVEDIRVPWLPQFLARPVGAAAAQGFRTSLRRMGRGLAHAPNDTALA